MKNTHSRKFDALLAMQEKILRANPKAKALWEQSAPKRAISLSLARLRKEAGKTQKDIAEITGWNKAFVSRLEGAVGGVPDGKTIERYVAACNAMVGYVFYTEDKKGVVHVMEATPLSPATERGRSGSFERLRNLNISVQTGKAKA